MSGGESDPRSDEKTRAGGRLPRKGGFVFLVKTLIGIPLLLVGLWLLHLVYFPEFGLSALWEEAPPKEDHQVFQTILRTEDPVPPDHFHMVDRFVSAQQPEPYRPLCYLCHGNYPHSKHKRVRSFLNMHSGFMACSVCHVRKDPEDKTYDFVWVDRQTGQISTGVEGMFGRYPAKIFPIIETDRGGREIFRPVSEQAAEKFIELKNQFTPDQMSLAKTKLHRRLTEKPVMCAECHKQGGYFDFAHLGFPQNRVDYLSSNEISRMIETYETFHIPDIINFGSQ